MIDGTPNVNRNRRQGTAGKLNRSTVHAALEVQAIPVAHIRTALEQSLIGTDAIDMTETRLAIRAMYEAFGIGQPACIIEVTSPIARYAAHNVMSGRIGILQIMSCLFGPLAAPVTRELSKECQRGVGNALAQLSKYELSTAGGRCSGRHMPERFKAAITQQLGRFYAATTGIPQGWLGGTFTEVRRRGTRNALMMIDDLIASALEIELLGAPGLDALGMSMGGARVRAAELALTRLIAEHYKLPLGSASCKRAFAVQRVLEAAHNVSAYRNVCFVQSNPVKIVRDPEGRAHCDTGPAVQWSDGFSIYAWHGVQFPGRWLDKKTLTPSKALQMRNIEHRRVACEILGWDRILGELPGVVVVDADPDPHIGTLVRARLVMDTNWGADREWCFLRVKCGTGRTFALPVPPTMRTAREANAWTYGLAANEYDPEVRT